MRTPFFPVSLNLVGRRCVVVGRADDREAVEKAAALREAGADLCWIQDPAELRDEQVATAFLVISTPQDAGLSQRLRALADRHRFLLCCIDQPAYGFVAMAAIAKSGPVRVAISTTGLAPRVGKVLRDALQRVMDAKFARFIEALARQREAARAEFPEPEQSAVRRAKMIEAARGFEADVRVRYPDWFEADDAER